MMRRLRAACRWGQPQIDAVMCMTPLNVLAWAAGERPLWVLVLALGMWPAVVCVVNFINPRTPPAD